MRAATLFGLLAVSLVTQCLHAEEISKDQLTRDLQEVARVTSVMIDGDVCQQIMTPRALRMMFEDNPNDRWAGSDNFDVNAEPYIQIKKMLIRSSRLLSYPVDCNLWMPFSEKPGKIQILIRNRYEMSQFWTWGVLFQDQAAEMARVLATGNPETVAQKGDYVSVLTPVFNSLRDVVGLVEVVSRLHVDPEEHVK